MAFTRRPIQAVKQVYNNGFSLVAATHNTTINHVVGVDAAADLTGNQNVPTGSRIMTVDVTLLAQGSASNSSFYLYYGIARGGQSRSADFPSPISVGASNTRNQIIHQHLGPVGTINGYPFVFRKRIRIPRSYQRVREGDAHFIAIYSDVAVEVDTQIIYKFYR